MLRKAGGWDTDWLDGSRPTCSSGEAGQVESAGVQNTDPSAFAFDDMEGFYSNFGKERGRQRMFRQSTLIPWDVEW